MEKYGWIETHVRDLVMEMQVAPLVNDDGCQSVSSRAWLVRTLTYHLPSIAQTENVSELSMADRDALVRQKTALRQIRSYRRPEGTICVFSLVAPQVRACPLANWLAKAANVAPEDISVTWKTGRTLGRWLQNTFPPKLQLQGGTCRCNRVPELFKIDGHVASFDLGVLNYFEGISHSFIESIQELHESCVVVPEDWVATFEEEYKCALQHWLEHDEAALVARTVASQVEAIHVPQEEWSLLLPEAEIQDQRTALRRHLVVVPGDKGGIAAICALKYAEDCKKHVGLPALPTSLLTQRLNRSYERTSGPLFTILDVEGDNSFSFIKRVLAGTLLAKQSKVFVEALPYLYLLPKKIDFSREPPLRYRGIGGRSLRTALHGREEYLNFCVERSTSSTKHRMQFSRALV